MSHTPTTAAIVTCTEPKFENVLQIEDPDLVSLFIVVLFNGISPAVGDRVVFPRNATQSVKQAAVRDMVNALLQTNEPGLSLTNANIQIMGLPV